MCDIHPILVWCDQYPGIAESLMSLGSVVEFPTETAVAKERYSAERNDLENERKCGLEGNPERVVGADGSVDYGYVEL